jgi:hypothetical protein
VATVRQYRGRYLADFRDQHGRRRIEVPEGLFKTKAEEKLHSFTPDRQRLDSGGLCRLFLASKVKARKTTLDGYRELIDCYLVPYIGSGRKVETLTRFEVEQFRNDMAKGTPLPVAKARATHPRAPGAQRARAAASAEARAANHEQVPHAAGGDCGVCGRAWLHEPQYRREHGQAAGAAGEGGGTEQNVLTPAELRGLIEAAVDHWAMPIHARCLHRRASG